MRCFDEKDTDGLVAMFCKKSQNHYDLESEINTAFEQYDGKSISYRIDSKGGWAGEYTDGVCIDKHNSPEISEIVTTSDAEYCIGFCIYEIYAADEGMVGISVIDLRDYEGNSLATIGGFGWE